MSIATHRSTLRFSRAADRPLLKSASGGLQQLTIGPGMAHVPRLADAMLDRGKIGVGVTHSGGRRPVFLSGRERFAVVDPLGRAPRSHSFVEQGYGAAFRHAGLDPVEIGHPESYARAADLPGYTDTRWPAIHVAIRSPKAFRPCPTAYNVQVFAWAFDVLRTDDTFGDGPFDNQLRMLNVADEIWTQCSYSQTVLRNHGVRKVRVIPSPVVYGRTARLESPRDRLDALASIGSHGAYLLTCHTMQFPDVTAHDAEMQPIYHHDRLLRAAEAGTLFVAVLDPEDFSQNLDALLLGFHAAAEKHETAALVIKLDLPPELRGPRALTGLLAQAMPCFTSIATDRIVLVTDVLEGDALASLYKASSFYLSASFAEGQNLLLQEAMVHGCVAVSPLHTAMLDYLDDDNCVPMASEQVRMWTDRIAATSTRRPFKVSRPRIVDVARAVRRALSLSADAVGLLSSRGADRIVASYSVEAVGSRLLKALDEIATESRREVEVIA